MNINNTTRQGKPEVIFKEEEIQKKRQYSLLYHDSDNITEYIVYINYLKIIISLYISFIFGLLIIINIFVSIVFESPVQNWLSLRIEYNEVINNINLKHPKYKKLTDK